MGDVALVDGAFDPWHPGHIRYLQEARRLAYDLSDGATLTCQVASDKYVATKHVPLLPYRDRVELVSHFVDDIYEDPTTTAETIIALRPKLYIKGSDWRTSLPAEIRNACRAVECEVEFTNTITHSSGELLRNYRETTEALGLEWLEAFIDHQSQQERATFNDAYFERQGFTLDKRREIEGNHPYLIKSVFQPTSVIDYGCGPGHLVKMLEEIGIPHVVGYDPYVKGGHNPDYLATDYDLVICREVLEHVPVGEYAQIVSDLCDLSSRFVYVTARFNRTPSSLFDVQASDNLDPTHISRVNITLLRALFTLNGLTRHKRYEEKLDHTNQGRCLVYEH